MGFFKRGYSAVREEKKRQDTARENRGTMLWKFLLKEDGEEATVRFLTEEPINFYQHTIRGVRNGKEFFDTKICTGDDCPYCENGDRASFTGAYILIDKRPYSYTDKNGKKVNREAVLRLYTTGTRVLSQLDRLSQRYGLASRDYTITRNGTGTSTSYLIDRTDNTEKVIRKEIENLMSDKMREMYDGTMESLYRIVQDQLERQIESDTGSSYHSDSSDDEDDDMDDSYNSTLVGVQDDEEKKPTPSAKKLAKRKLGFKK